MLDHCSTEHYVMLDIVEKYKLYKVPVKDKFGAVHDLDCYGLSVIASQQSRQVKNEMVRSAKSLELKLGGLVEWICYYR